MMPDRSAQDWARWWCDAWQGAHASWQVAFAERVGLALPACAQLAQRRPEVFMRFSGMTVPLPPTPDANTLQWLALEPSQQQLALALVEQICVSDQANLGQADQHAPWCRSLAKALRPGLWLESLESEALPGCRLLGAWTGPDCWARLRLGWPVQPWAEAAGRDVVSSANGTGKLHTLWAAVLWRVVNARRGQLEVSDAG